MNIGWQDRRANVKLLEQDKMVCIETIAIKINIYVVDIRCKWMKTSSQMKSFIRN